MFFGDYFSFVDWRWRFYLPLAFRAMFGVDPDSERILRAVKNGYLEIYPFCNDGYAGDVRANGRNVFMFARITIPKQLRHNGLCVNCPVSIVGMGDHLEIRPLSAIKGDDNEAAKV